MMENEQEYIMQINALSTSLNVGTYSSVTMITCEYLFASGLSSRLCLCSGGPGKAIEVSVYTPKFNYFFNRESDSRIANVSLSDILLY